MGHSEHYRARSQGHDWERLERLASRSGVASSDGGLADNGVGARMHRLYEDPQRRLLKLEIPIDGMILGLMERPPQLIVGTIPSARTIVMMPMGRIEDVSANGAPLDENSFFIACQGARFRILERQDWLAAGVSFLDNMDTTNWPGASSTGSVLRTSPELAGQIRTSIWSAAEAWHETPARICEPDFARRIKDGIQAHFAAALASPQTEQVEARGTIRAYDTIVRQIDAFLEARQAERIQVEDVADALGVSPRTIHNAMLAICGKSLYRYLRERRMWSARAMLMDGDRLIKQVALANGYAHFGRFTQQYTQMFGEQPSETQKLGRLARANAGPARVVQPCCGTSSCACQETPH